MFQNLINEGIFKKEINIHRSNAISIIRRTIDRYSIAANQAVMDNHILEMIDNPEKENIKATSHLVFLKTNFKIEEVFILTEEGKLLYSNAKDNVIFNSPEFKNLVKFSLKGKTAVADFLDSEALDSPVLYIARSVRGENKNGVVVFGKIFDNEQMLSIFPYVEGETRGILLFSRDGKVASSNQKNEMFNKLLKPYIDKDFFQRVQNGSEYSNVFNNPDFKGIIKISSVEFNTLLVRPFGFYIEAGDLMRMEDSFIFYSIITLIVMILLISLSILVTKKKIIDPVVALKKGFESLLSDNYFYSIIPVGFLEIKQIGNGYSAAIKKISGNIADLENKNNEITKSLEKEKILEYHLKKEHDHVEAIVNSVNDSILVLDTSLNVLLANDSAEKILGKPKSDLVGKYLGDIIEVYKDNLKFSYENCFIFDAMFLDSRITTRIGENYSYIAKDGKKVPIIMAVSSLRGAGRDRGVVLMIRDITSEKKLDDAKINFISTASHQLRTPLTSLRWFSEMLMDGDAGKINKNQKTFLNNIYEGVARMINLVNLLLQMARVEAGRVKIEPIAVNLPKMSENVAAALKAEIEKKKLKVKVETASKKIPDIYMDYDVIWQVLQNLISNAIRYSLEKGIITVKIEKKGELIELSVKDGGIGIPKNQQGRIFEKFYRANNAAQAVPEGSGLGLTLVKLLVEGWDGKVWFESKEGKGATFFITVPLSGMEAKEGEVKLAV